MSYRDEVLAKLGDDVKLTAEQLKEVIDRNPDGPEGGCRRLLKYVRKNRAAFVEYRCHSNNCYLCLVLPIKERYFVIYRDLGEYPQVIAKDEFENYQTILDDWESYEALEEIHLSSFADYRSFQPLVGYSVDRGFNVEPLIYKGFQVNEEMVIESVEGVIPDSGRDSGEMSVFILRCSHAEKALNAAEIVRDVRQTVNRRSRHSIRFE